MHMKMVYMLLNTLTCVQDAIRLLTMILGVTPLDNDPCPLSLATSPLTNLRGGITLGEHDLLVDLTGSLSVPALVSSSSGSNSSFCDNAVENRSIMIHCTCIRCNATFISVVLNKKYTGKITR